MTARLTSNQDLSIQAHRDECVLSAARAIQTVALNLIFADPHQWSTRPCTTCRAVTALAGQPFGCDRYRKERGA